MLSARFGSGVTFIGAKAAEWGSAGPPKRRDLSETGAVMAGSRATPKIREGAAVVRVRAVPHDPRQGWGIYRSPEHARASRSRPTVDAVVRRAAEAEYQRIRRGQASPVPHLGWLTTTDGVVLDGSVVLELHALIEQHRVALIPMRTLVARRGAAPESLRTHLAAPWTAPRVSCWPARADCSLPPPRAGLSRPSPAAVCGSMWLYVGGSHR